MNINFQRICAALNPLEECKKYGVPPFQCPQFLFLIIGAIIIAAIITTHSIAALKINNPKIVNLIVLAVAFVLIIIDYIITKSFERLAEASQMKTEFINIVSHQLRAPLTNLKYALETLKREKIKKDKLKYFDILEENSQRMEDLVNDLLVIARIETGKFPSSKEAVSITELTKKVILKFKPQTEASNIEVKFQADKNIPRVAANRTWLEGAIGNLLDNAIHYIKPISADNQGLSKNRSKGKIKIKIKKKKKEIYFEIQDNGIGIPKNDQKYIFQKFFRASNGARYQTNGSGLGLYIVKKVLKLIGGKIYFSSKENKGSIFYFILPVKNEKNTSY